MAATYKDGNKYEWGKTIPGVVFLTTLSSNKRTIYSAIKYADGTSSCDCPGWTMHSKSGRGCKHSREVEAMTASRDDTGKAVQPAPVASTAAKPVKPGKQMRSLTFEEDEA